MTMKAQQVIRCEAPDGHAIHLTMAQAKFLLAGDIWPANKAGVYCAKSTFTDEEPTMTDGEFFELVAILIKPPVPR
jgi:hypothetical protein